VEEEAERPAREEAAGGEGGIRGGGRGERGADRCRRGTPSAAERA
jgi:hypothetical protein